MVLISRNWSSQFKKNKRNWNSGFDFDTLYKYVFNVNFIVISVMESGLATSWFSVERWGRTMVKSTSPIRRGIGFSILGRDTGR